MCPQAPIFLKIRRHDRGRSAGFALVIALGLMAFVLLLLLTITTMVRVEQRSAETSLRQLEAEQNALLGLQVALGELQLTLGPDQRVSATADILDNASDAPDVSQRHLTGAWSSHPVGETIRGQTYAPNGRQRIQWLVSGGGREEAYHQTAVDPDAPDNVLLVGAGSLADSNDNGLGDDRVVVALDSIGESGGQYGWWVGDEGVKARLNLSDSSQQAGLGSNERKQSSIRIFGSSSRSDLGTLAGLEPVDLQAGGLAEKIIGLSDLSMDSSVSSDDAKQHFHALTTDSMGVLADTKNGGLKQDLSLAFELDDTAFNASVFGSGGPDTITSPGFGQVQPIFRLPNTTGTPANGPAWHLLRDYYGIYKRIENPMTDPIFKAQAFRPNDAELGGVDMWHDLAALRYMDRVGNAEQGDPLRATGGIADKGIFPGVRGALAIPVKANYLPYVQRNLLAMALEFYEIAPPADDTSGYEFHNIRLLLNPAFVVHNPYNVKVKHEGLASYNRSLHFTIKIESLLDNVFSKSEKVGPIVYMLKTPGDTLDPGEMKIYEGIRTWGKNTGYSEEGVPKEPWKFQGSDRYSFQLPYDPGGGGNVRVFYQPLNNNNWTYTLYHAISIFDIDDSISDLTNAGKDLEQRGQTYSNYGGFRVSKIFREFADWYGGEDTSGREINTYNYLSGGPLFPLFNFDLLLKPAEMDPGINRFPYPSLSHTNPLAPIMAMRNLFPVEVKQSTPGYGWPVLSPNWQLNIYSTPEDGNNAPGMDVLESSGTSGYWGTSNTGAGQTSVAMIELPTSPALGLGQLQHANISLFNNMPAFVVGNSFASPYIPRDKKYAIFKNEKEQDRIYYDISYLTNEVLWDRYFFSSYSLPYDGGSDEYSGTVGDSFNIAFDPDSYSGDSPFESLPNPRMRLHLGEGEDTDAVKAKLFDGSDDPLSGAYARAAENLMVAGSFNVNSTSVEAWKTLLASSRNLSIYRSGETGAESYSADSTPFPRLQQPAKAALENGDYDDDEAWGGFANLDDPQLEQLAQSIVAEIKLRVADKGVPYLSLVSFVNRELSTNAFGLCGVLQAAIDKSGINAKFDDSFVQLDASNLQSSVGRFPEPSNIKDAGGGPRSTATAASAQLIAGDLLQAISSTLSARSDTFRIRAYGETRNPVSGEVGGRAWCEAVVQRLPEPVSPGAAAASDADYWEPAADDTMGRRFEIIRLRWLTPEEV